MLDFFLIDDHTPTIIDTAHLSHIGGLSLKEYDRFIRMGFIEEKYSYFDDFRWSHATIQQLNQTLSNFSQDNTDIVKLKALIFLALQHQCGLIAITD